MNEIKCCARYLSVVTSKKGNADGLVNCLNKVLKRLGIQDVLDRDGVLLVQLVLIGGRTDCASVNISQHNGMRGKVQRALPWLFCVWCYAHCLEFVSTIGLRSRLFKDVEMFLRLYYLYEKSPKSM